MVEWELEFEPFIRRKPEKINPLLVIRSPRDIKAVKECYDTIDMVDKLWVKYFPVPEMQKVIRRYVSAHPEYTHIILTADDVYPSRQIFLVLLSDINIYNFPVIAGCCDTCITKSINHSAKCNLCDKWTEKYPYEHPHIAIVLEHMDYLDESGHRKPVSVLDVPFPYNWITQDFRRRNFRIVRCWFQPLALGAIRRDVFEMCACLPYLPPRLYSDDFSLAVECYEAGIPQFCDLRVYMQHDWRFHDKIKVGVERPRLIFEKARM